ncbi:MAG: 16S rRNA (guanine(966)-N(2))-methyltransferase RsmD [Gammaproteobacteria bacterium]
MKISGGRWRGHRLPTAPKGVRPSTARTRLTLFNWLGSQIIHRRCLDLFAGSGALSFDSLSRGASHATLLDPNPQCCRRIRQSAQALGCADDISLICADNRAWLPRCKKPLSGWNLIFIDPPWHMKSITAQLQALTKRQLVSPDALLYIESPPDAFQPLGPWQLDHESTQSDISMRLYSYTEI